MKDGDKFARICRSTFSSMPSIYATISQKHFLNLPFHKTFFYIGRFKSWKSFVWNALKRKSLRVVRHFCLEHARGAWRDLLLVTRPFPIGLGIKLLSNFWRLELLFAVPATSSKFCLSELLLISSRKKSTIS